MGWAGVWGLWEEDGGVSWVVMGCGNGRIFEQEQDERKKRRRERAGEVWEQGSSFSSSFLSLIMAND
jgi:hypothetical protein